MTHTPTSLITRIEAAHRAGVSPRTIDRWIRQERLIKYVDAQGHVSVDEFALLRLITPVPVRAAVQ